MQNGLCYSAVWMKNIQNTDERVISSGTSVKIEVGISGFGTIRTNFEKPCSGGIGKNEILH